MGVTKYERVNRRDENEDDDEDEQEVELGNRTAAVEYGEGGSSSLLASSPSPIKQNYKHKSGSDYRRGHQQGTNKATALNTIIYTALVILLYFTLSIGLTFYQSALLKVSFIVVIITNKIRMRQINNC